jgi:uncharacterized protein (DUF433 family)
MVPKNRIVLDPAICHGKPAIRGTFVSDLQRSSHD